MVLAQARSQVSEFLTNDLTNGQELGIVTPMNDGKPASADRGQRETLLETATAEFAANGFESTSVQSIATAAGVSKAKLFYYFEGKEALYSEVLAHSLEPLLGPLESITDAASAEAFWESLESGLQFAFEFVARDPHTAALVRGLYRRGGHSPSLERLLDRARTAVCTWLLDGQQLGAVRTDLPVQVLAEAAVGALVHIDRWLASSTETGAAAEMLVPASALSTFARDALRQRIAAECVAEVAYATDDAPLEIDAYLDVNKTVNHEVLLRDGRVTQPAPRFGEEGFELISAPVIFDLPPTDGEARAAYHLLETTLKDHLGAAFARVFDHTIRHTESTPGRRPPIRVTHADYGRDAGIRRFQEVLSGDEASAWKNARIVVANLWQSLAGVVHSTPLGFVDLNSVRDEDFIPVTVHYPDRDGEIGYYRHNDAHRWFWFPFLRPTEALLFKTFDGAPDSGHWSCPHAAFTAPNAPIELNGRRTSIEFRVLLAFTPDT